MKDKFLLLAMPFALASCSTDKLQVSSEFEIAKGQHKFGSDLVLLYSSTSPDLKMRPSGIANVKYNVASWKSLTGKDLLAQVKRDAAETGDGFDDDILSSSNDNRTASLFGAGVKVALSPIAMEHSGDTTILRYEDNEYASILAKVFESEGEVCFKVEMQTAQKGYFSIGFMNAPEASFEATQEIWQPLIWQEKRFPDQSYMTLAYRATIPSTLATINGTTYGVVAHPDEFPFDPLPVMNNSRFGVAVRNDEGNAQAMLFAPVLGGKDSKMNANTKYDFTAILHAENGSCMDSYEDIATSIYNFGDYRRNDIATLNSVFENVTDYAMSDYAWFVDSLKGCAYSTDVPGAVKNVSALNPLEFAIVADREDYYTKRAYPIMEYQISREKFLFALDKEQKIQYPSRRLLGPIAPISELTSLYNIFGKNMPFLTELATKAYSEDKIRNLDVVEEGDSWMNSMFMYKATGDNKYLQKAIEDADTYIAERMTQDQTDFSDKMAGGFFFWTGYTPRWIYLLEMYEMTGEQLFLDAAQDGARYYTQFCWMSPRIPDTDIHVNKGGKAPWYAYLKGKGHPQMSADEETAPAWRLSEMGLTPESSGTSTGHRAIFMSHFAPWMLRIAHYAHDQFLKDVAKAAVIGRYRNFPGYHINTARTTIYEKEDYPFNTHHNLSVNSFHYNHIMPMASMLLDYLVSDAFVRSDGAIDFPSEFIEAYAYLQSKFYGHKQGTWYGEKVWLWMPAKLVETGSVELNYISARSQGKVFVALANQSQETVKTWVKLNPSMVKMGDIISAVSEDGEEYAVKDGKVLVTVPAGGQISVCFNGAEAIVKFQDAMIGESARWSNDYTELEVGNAQAMIFNCGTETQNLYLYLEDDDEFVKKAILNYKDAQGKVKTITDSIYPYEFTVPAGIEKVEFQLTVVDHKGRSKTSDWKTLNK